jgi:NAD(P)-dependent dehydrogenase (short-subunit alcohol dehydrogenase family)
MHLALLDVDADALAELAPEIRALTGVTTAVVRADVALRDDVRAAAETIAGTFGAVHVLVSNAGVAARGHLYEMDPDTFDWLMSVNVTGTFNVIRAFVPAMLAHGEPGHVLITASNASLYPLPGRLNGAYAASKMADFGMAQSLRASLQGTNLGCTALCPAVVATSIQQSGRHRPVRYGGPFERTDASGVRGGMTSDDVARIAVRAIVENDPLAITHPGGRELFDAHCDDLGMAHDRWAERLPGMRIDAALSAL